MQQVWYGRSDVIGGASRRARGRAADVRDRRHEKDSQESGSPEQQAPDCVTSVEARRAMHSSGAPPRQPCCPEFPAGEQPMDRASIPGSERVAVPAPVRSLPGRGGRHNIDQGSRRGDTHSYMARSDEVDTQVPCTRALRIRRGPRGKSREGAKCNGEAGKQARHNHTVAIGMCSDTGCKSRGVMAGSGEADRRPQRHPRAAAGYCKVEGHKGRNQGQRQVPVVRWEAQPLERQKLPA
jgi:hypothetical protein